jgi:hypothetical protein
MWLAKYFAPSTPLSVDDIEPVNEELRQKFLKNKKLIEERFQAEKREKERQKMIECARHVISEYNNGAPVMYCEGWMERKELLDILHSKGLTEKYNIEYRHGYTWLTK